MKKALLVLLAVLLVAGSVFAQSATETKASSGPDELTYWATLNAAITANSFDELPYWQELMARTNDPLEKIVCDYISSMTDRYAISIYSDLFVPVSWSVK